MTTIALIFPGQGSQSTGMLKELATVYPAVQRRFVEASDILGLDLWHISQENPSGELDQTAITQPVASLRLTWQGIPLVNTPRCVQLAL